MANTRRKRSNESNNNNTTNQSNDAAEIIERIIHAAESREANSRESSVANNVSKSEIITEGGPFTDSELSQLSLLRLDWTEVDADTVVSLAGMLSRHVAAGVGIDLVREGRNVVTMKGDDAPVISVQQVRLFTVCLFVGLV